MGLGALLNNQLGHGPKVPKVMTYTLFLSQDVEIEHIFALWTAVFEIMADFQNCHIWACNLHALPLAKIPKWHIYSLSPRGSKLSSFSLYGQWILRYWPNFKTVIFWHEFQKLHIHVYSLSTPGGRYWAYFCSTGSEIWTNFQNCHIWAWNLASSQSPRSLHIYPHYQLRAWPSTRTLNKVVHVHSSPAHLLALVPSPFACTQPQPIRAYSSPAQPRPLVPNPFSRTRPQPICAHSSYRRSCVTTATHFSKFYMVHTTSHLFCLLFLFFVFFFLVYFVLLLFFCFFFRPFLLSVLGMMHVQVRVVQNSQA